MGKRKMQKKAQKLQKNYRDPLGIGRKEKLLPDSVLPYFHYNTIPG